MANTTESTLPIRLKSTPETKVRSLWGDAFRRLFLNKLAVLGLIIVIIFLIAAIIGPYVTPYDFLEQNLSKQLQGPSAEHWLGTDALGRDIFSRMLHGARTAALVGFVSTAISLGLGIILGTTAGFLRGWVDEFLMWLTDVTMSLPGLLLALLVNTALKRPIAAWFDIMYTRTKDPFYLNTLWLDFVLVFGALALISWPGFARLIRGQVLSIRETMYVEAARGVGADTRRIMGRHIVPNALGPLVVAVTAGIGGAITLESALSFLGIGVQPPNASWGSMLDDGRSLMLVSPHLMLIPAATIGIIVIAFTFLGDGLNDALNPRQVIKK